MKPFHFITTISLSIILFSQNSKYQGLIFDFTKFNTRSIFISQIKPQFRYFEDYHSRGGLEFSYLFSYQKFLEFAPTVGMHYFNNDSTHMRAMKTDFMIKNYFKISKKDVVFLRLGSSFGFSLFTIWNSMHSDYFYTHTYHSLLFNLDASIFCQLAEDIYLKGTLGNSYFYILHDKLLIDEKISRHNDFHYFSLGMLFVFTNTNKD